MIHMLHPRLGLNMILGFATFQDVVVFSFFAQFLFNISLALTSLTNVKSFLWEHLFYFISPFFRSYNIGNLYVLFVIENGCRI